MRTLYTLLAAVVVVGAATAVRSAGQVRLEGDPARRELLAAIQGKPAPDLELARWVRGGPKRLADLKGKVVLLDFWGTWCGPCVAAIPHTNEMARKYGPRGLEVVAVHTPWGAEKLNEFVKDRGIQYSVALDASADASGRKGKTIERYRVDSFPDYYLIDRRGILRYADAANADVDTAVEQLLAEPAP